MADIPSLQIDRKTSNKLTFYLNVGLFLILAVFLYLLVIDSFNAGRLTQSLDSLMLSSAWLAVAMDIVFVTVGLVIIFVQIFRYHRQLSRRSF
jgi:hypothetical protein